MMRWKLLVLVLVLGASSTFAKEAEEPTEGEAETERVCVSKRNINTFEAIDNEHVYIKASLNDHYLLTMRSKCFGLRRVDGFISFESTTSRVCSGDFTKMTYRFLGASRSCRISTIETVAGKDHARALVEDRKEARREAGEKKKKGEE